MPQSEYIWETDSLPIIKNHSLAKHEVLSSYLYRYVQKLVPGPHVPQLRLNIVDGFSGGGAYLKENQKSIHFGSPVIFYETIKNIETEINQARINSFKINSKFYFIEEKKSNFNFLKTTLNNKEIPFAENDENAEVTLINQNFSDVADKIIANIKRNGGKNRTIFLLDQYGYTDVPMPLIRKIFEELPFAEILLTFATDWIIDYLSNNEEQAKAIEKRFSHLGLISKDFDIDVKSIKESAKWRRVAQATLSESIQLHSGAKFYRPFFIKSEHSHRSYWFIHLSQHVVASDQMTQVHWEKHNCFTHPGGAGLQMAGYSPELDDRINKQTGFDFGFDETAKEISLHNLENELPDFLFNNGAMTFRELLEKVSNHTPADSELIKEILNTLIVNKDIYVRCIKSTGFRNKGNAIKMTDIIEPKQRSFFY